MVVIIIIKDDNGKQVKSIDFHAQPDENWKETSYRIGCKVASETAQIMLSDMGVYTILCKVPPCDIMVK